MIFYEIIIDNASLWVDAKFSKDEIAVLKLRNRGESYKSIAREIKKSLVSVKSLYASSIRKVKDPHSKYGINKIKAFPIFEYADRVFKQFKFDERFLKASGGEELLVSLIPSLEYINGYVVEKKWLDYDIARFCDDIKEKGYMTEKEYPFYPELPFLRLNGIYYKNRWEYIGRMMDLSNKRSILIDEKLISLMKEIDPSSTIRGVSSSMERHFLKISKTEFMRHPENEKQIADEINEILLNDSLVMFDKLTFEKKVLNLASEYSFDVRCMYYIYRKHYKGIANFSEGNMQFVSLGNNRLNIREYLEKNFNYEPGSVLFRNFKMDTGYSDFVIQNNSNIYRAKNNRIIYYDEDIHNEDFGDFLRKLLEGKEGMKISKRDITKDIAASKKYSWMKYALVPFSFISKALGVDVQNNINDKAYFYYKKNVNTILDINNYDDL